jgi:hypothetical protein
MSRVSSGAGACRPCFVSDVWRFDVDEEALAPQSPRAFLRFRFVEAVATCFPNLPVPAEE